jgi:hypothetical protein
VDPRTPSRPYETLARLVVHFFFHFISPLFIGLLAVNRKIFYIILPNPLPQQPTQQPNQPTMNALYLVFSLLLLISAFDAATAANNSSSTSNNTDGTVNDLQQLQDYSGQCQNATDTADDCIKAFVTDTTGCYDCIYSSVGTAFNATKPQCSQLQAGVAAAETDCPNACGSCSAQIAIYLGCSLSSTLPTCSVPTPSSSTSEAAPARAAASLPAVLVKAVVAASAVGWLVGM